MKGEEREKEELSRACLTSAFICRRNRVCVGDQVSRQTGRQEQSENRCRISEERPMPVNAHRRSIAGFTFHQQQQRAMVTQTSCASRASIRSPCCADVAASPRDASVLCTRLTSADKESYAGGCCLPLASSPTCVRVCLCTKTLACLSHSPNESLHSRHSLRRSSPQ